MKVLGIMGLVFGVLLDRRYGNGRLWLPIAPTKTTRTLITS